MTDANSDVHDCLMRRTGMYIMDIGFSSAGRFWRAIAGIYSLDYANSLQCRHSLQLGGSRATMEIRWTFLKDKQKYSWTIIWKKRTHSVLKHCNIAIKLARRLILESIIFFDDEFRSCSIECCWKTLKVERLKKLSKKGKGFEYHRIKKEVKISYTSRI